MVTCRCQSLCSGKEVAIKVMPYKTQDDIEAAEQEREGLKLTQSVEGCLSYHAAFRRPDSLSLVLECALPPLLARIILPCPARIHFALHCPASLPSRPTPPRLFPPIPPYPALPLHLEY